MTQQRPQYGEIATPEEQRRAAGLPPLEASAPNVAPPASGPAHPPVRDEGFRRPHRADRLVTIGLLAYGLVSVIVTAVSYLDLPRVMNESMKILGIEGEFTNFAQGKLWGTIAAVVLVAGWSLTAWLSVRRLRRGKITWWMPLVGAVITMGIVSVCMAVPMFGDPAFMSYVENMGG
ncbi:MULTISPECIES: DUF6264 family protein [unclassified Microbacterium]|uniref:DUF6264 family protein n=1 Tax=unclassified Microbacterium TaxID=2609290 RepID=UPI000EAAB9EA|nr:MULTISPECIES: DUF6264 family protein [unclassified Microbacterium]MBT2485274.1 hypothetical protein [Microbacterium sp. ISL-108]RKN68090.1 hypothetical protein D7252_11180 [Microbacterium sp. CGR2]